jgi:DNA-binding NarL/FixJ family response regulator
MKPIKVLVAEDEQEVREVLSAVISTDKRLRLVGAAGEPESAIELASQQRPDVALVDVRMPGGGGVRAAREIVRRSPPTTVIAFSAFEDVETVLSMLRAGARYYVSKADPTDEILHTIHRAAEDVDDQRTEIERVVVGLDEWRDHRRQHSSLDRVRVDRIESVLARGAMGVELRPVLRLASGEVVGREAFPSFAATGDSANALKADARSVGMLKQLELGFVDLALRELDRLPDSEWLGIAVSPETALSAQLLDVLDASVTSRVVLQLNDPNPIFDRVGVERATQLWRGVGARVAIQDVGCGAETLRLFVRVRPEFVYLDPVLSDQVECELSRQAVVRALVSIAEDIGSTAVATGILSQDATGALMRLGVELARDEAYAATVPDAVSGIEGEERA